MNIKEKIKIFFDFKKNTKIRYFYLVQLFLVFINDGLNKNILTNNKESTLKKVINSIFLLIFNSSFPLLLFRSYNLENKNIYIITGLSFGIISDFISRLFFKFEGNGDCAYENNISGVIQSDTTVVSKTLNRIINTTDFIVNFMLLSVNIKDFKIFDVWLCTTYIFFIFIIGGLCCKYFENSIFNLACKDYNQSLTKCKFNNLSDRQKIFYFHSFLIGPVTAALLVKNIQKWLDVN